MEDDKIRLERVRNPGEGVCFVTSLLGDDIDFSALYGLPYRTLMYNRATKQLGIDKIFNIQLLRVFHTWEADELIKIIEGNKEEIEIYLNSALKNLIQQYKDVQALIGDKQGLRKWGIKGLKLFYIHDHDRNLVYTQPHIALLRFTKQECIKSNIPDIRRTLVVSFFNKDIYDLTDKTCCDFVCKMLTEERFEEYLKFERIYLIFQKYFSTVGSFEVVDGGVKLTGDRVFIENGGHILDTLLDENNMIKFESPEELDTILSLLQ